MGKVFLVGAGPGDPGLITVRGRERLERADVVVYDALTHPELLRYAPNAEHIFVGKKRDQHSLPQEEINRILVEQTQRHACVVRLKGGDPFVFGRGGEEALALAAAGVPFEIVPGVSAGVAAPAYAGIPVTHRGLSSSVTFLTAHLDADDKLPDIYQSVKNGTLVLFMGVKSLPQMRELLGENGRGADTPVAVIEWGTYARQRTITGTLDDIVGRCDEAGIQAPALVVVGDVCTLREELHWFEQRPLHGLRVAVTHAVERQGALETRLRELGAEIFSLPMMSVAPPPESGADWDPADFDWIILNSVNAAKTLFEVLDKRGLDARSLAGVKLCAVGASTRSALEGRFLHPDAAPESYGTESTLAALREHGDLAGARILLPRSDIARRSLPEALREAGATVTETVAYTHQRPDTSPEDMSALREFAPDLLVFTNAAAVENFALLSAGAPLSAEVASIGPVTSAAARQCGFRVAVEPAQHTVHDLLEALCVWWDKQKNESGKNENL